jgi:hypothetical protein
MRNLIILTLLLGLLAFGCLGSQSSSEGGNTASAPLRMMDSAVGSAYAPSSAPQYVTKEGYISIRVNEGELQAKFDSMKAQLKSDGAELSDVRYTESGDRKQYTITMKVVPGKFEGMMATLQKVGDVKDMSVNLEDVTQQYVDLDTRIKNKEIELTRLYQLYNQSSKVSDLLDVERELTRVETDLELLKGQKQYLSSKIDKSTINVTVYEEKPASTQLSISLDGIASLFFAAIGAAITLIVVAVGFLLPIAAVMAVLWFAFKLLTGKKKAGPKQPEHSRIPPPE